MLSKRPPQRHGEHTARTENLKLGHHCRVAGSDAVWVLALSTRIGLMYSQPMH
jgi:hypothetical protein